MLYSIDCKADIAAQDATYPTYKGIDCDLHINANDDDFYGRLIDCDLSIITTLVTACTLASQSLRVIVTINSVDVTSALVGAITIQHNKNMISTFSLSLKNIAYSPLNSTNIVPNKVVVVTSYVNGYEVELFTGLIDDTSVEYTLDGFQININGSDYGKKLRNKRTTLVSIQYSIAERAINKQIDEYKILLEHAETEEERQNILAAIQNKKLAIAALGLISSHYRGALIKYLAAQAGVTSVDAPQGSYTRIDHSFEDQTILDMVTKELTVDTYWWRFDEKGTLKIALDEIKTNTTIYPTADWTYGEDRFFRLGLTTSDLDIINTVRILGTVYETQIEVDNPEDSPFNQYIDPPPSGYVDTQLAYFSNSWGQGVAIDWNASDGNFDLESHTGFCTAGGGTSSYMIPPGPSTTRYCFKITWNYDDYEVTGVDYSSSEYITVTYDSAGINIAKVGIKRTGVMVGGSYQEGSGSLQIGIRGKSKQSQDSPQEDPPTSAIVDNEEVASPTYEYEYDQVAANVVDSNSVAKYGERKPGTEGTLEFPLAENFDQCKGIGKKVIRDSHRFLKQPDFEVAFNPLLKVGQTIAISDKKIGYSERWYVEEVVHTVEQGKGRTRVGCVYYA